MNIFSDKLNNVVNFGNMDWKLTESEFYSPSSSMTDSPDDIYLPNSYLETTLKSPINLEACDKAYLTFYAKWAIESGYDYVQVLASKDNIDFIPLCGQYTK